MKLKNYDKRIRGRITYCFSTFRTHLFLVREDSTDDDIVQGLLCIYIVRKGSSMNGKVELSDYSRRQQMHVEV